MKHLFYLLMLLFSYSALPGQEYGITDLNINPQTPHEQDSVLALVGARFSTQQDLFAVEDTLINDTIYLDLHYCGGTLPAIDVREDTVNLGLLSVGNYQLVCTVSEYTVAVDEEGMLADTCSLDTIYRDTLAFQVELLDAIRNLKPPSLRISPNPTVDHLQLSVDAPLQLLRLWSASGQPIRQWRELPGTAHQLYLPDVPPGIYYLEMQFPDRKPYWHRIAVH